MKKRNAAYTLTFLGVVLLCITSFCIYKDFFEPKIGPIGTGERHWTTYATYTSAVLGSVIYLLYGIYLWIQQARVENRQ